MTFPHFNRRLHLYLGLTLVPWFLMYGISSIPFAHNQYFEERDRAKGLPLWTTRVDQSYSLEIPAEGELRPLGAKVMQDFGLDGAYGAYRQSPNQINVYVYRFLRSTQAKYFVSEKRIVIEDRRFRFDHFLTGMHARGGFEQEGFLNAAWAVAVDIACVGMLAWVFSGLYMWWSLPGLRKWGWIAFLGGTASFALFMMRL